MVAYSQRKQTVTLQDRTAGINLYDQMIDLSVFGAAVSGGTTDTIDLFDLPAGARILDAWLSNGVVGTVGALIQLRLSDGVNTTQGVIVTIPANTAAVTWQSRSIVVPRSTNVQTLQILASSATLLSTAVTINCGVEWSF